MAVTIDGTSGIVASGSITTQSASGVIFSDSSALTAASSPYVLKNRIINGDMRIDQRNAGASVTNVASAITYTLDRWNYYASQASKFTVQRNAGAVTPPAGYTYYFGVTSSSAYTIGSTEQFLIEQFIEGYNVADLDFGKSTAKIFTISFWVRSSLTGTFGGSLQNSAQDRCYPFSYTISAANTWEQKSITITADTTGTWDTTNGVGLRLILSIGTGATYSGTANAWSSTSYLSSVTGATSVVGVNGATWYITGVQLEIGSTATPFERRLYGQELINCQRYCQKTTDQQYVGGCSYSGGITNRTPFKVSMRAAPTATITTAGSWIFGNDFSANYTASTVAIAYTNLTTEGGRIGFSGWASQPTNGTYVAGSDVSGTAIICLVAEL